MVVNLELNKEVKGVQQSRVKTKKQLRWFLIFLNLKLDKVAQKDLFVLWMDIRERVYGEQGPLFIPNQLLLEWGKKRGQLKEFQNLFRNLLYNILHPVKISPVLNKPLRRITIDTEKPSTSIFNEENSERNSPIITHPFSIDIQRVGEKVSLFFSRLEDKLVFDFATGLTHFPTNLIQKCQRQDCGGYFLKGTKRENGLL